MPNENKPNTPQQTIEQLATQSDPGFLRELWDFLRHSKKWWLMPIVVAILLLGALVFLSGTAAAPFVYTFF